MLAVVAVFAEAIFTSRACSSSATSTATGTRIASSSQRALPSARFRSGIRTSASARRSSPIRTSCSPTLRPGSPCCCRRRSTTSSSRSATRCWRRPAPGRWRAGWGPGPRPRPSPAASTRSRARCLSSVNLFHHHAGAAWIPWVLWALEGLLRGPGVRAALTLGARGRRLRSWPGRGTCVSPPRSSARRGSRGGCRARARRRAAQACESSRATGRSPRCWPLALSAVQWLPTAELVSRSERAHMDLRTATYWSLHPASLADLVVPRLVADLPLSLASRAAALRGPRAAARLHLPRCRSARARPARAPAALALGTRARRSASWPSCC